MGRAFAANGCAPGTFTTTHSPDGNATSFLFDDFHVTSDSAQGRKREKCSTTAPITTGKGFSVFAVDYRGFVVKNADQSVSIKTGSNRRGESLYAPEGSITRDFAITRRMGSADASELALSIRLAANGNPGDINPAELYLDTIDVSRIGFTTIAAVRASLDVVARQRRDLMNRMRFLSSQMLGFSEPIAGDDYASAFGDINGTAGFAARWNANDELTLRAGIARAGFSDSGADVGNTFLFASSARYAVPLDATWMLFGEIGGWAAPGLEAAYMRSYLNESRLSPIISRSGGSMFGMSARMGVVLTPDSQNEFVLSARLSRSIFDIDAYSEKSNADNLFAAHVSGGRTNLNAADITLAWTRALASTVDYSLIAAGGQDFSSANAVSAKVDWVGKANGGWEASYTGSLGARLGWQFRDSWSVDTTAQANFRGDTDPEWNLEMRLKAKF